LLPGELERPQLAGHLHKRGEARESTYPSHLVITLRLHNPITSTTGLNPLSLVRIVHFLKCLRPLINHQLRNFRRVRLAHLHLQLNQHGRDSRIHALRMRPLASGTIGHHGEFLVGLVDKNIKFLFRKLFELRQHEGAVGYIVVGWIGNKDRERGWIVVRKGISLLFCCLALVLPLSRLVLLGPVVDSREIVDAISLHVRLLERQGRGGLGLDWVELLVQLKVSNLRLQS